MCPSNTNEQEVSLFKSSALAIFKVSLKYLLKRTDSWTKYSLAKLTPTSPRYIDPEKTPAGPGRNKPTLSNCENEKATSLDLYDREVP